jgi:Nucleoporin protein Ndc1-Nup
MSLTEDRYGVVQRDIPRILEALLAFLTALEDAQKEIGVSDDAEDTARAVDVYSRPADGTWFSSFHERGLPLMDHGQR